VANLAFQGCQFDIGFCNCFPFSYEDHIGSLSQAFNLNDYMTPSDITHLSLSTSPFAVPIQSQAARKEGPGCQASAVRAKPPTAPAAKPEPTGATSSTTGPTPMLADVAGFGTACKGTTLMIFVLVDGRFLGEFSVDADRGGSPPWAQTHEMASESTP